MSERPSFTVEYLEPVVFEAEPLPDEFSGSRLKRSLLILGAIVAVVVALIVLVPGLARCVTASTAPSRTGSRSPRFSSSARARPTCSCSGACSAVT